LEKKTLIEVLALTGTYLQQHANQKRSDSKALKVLNNTFFEEFEDVIKTEHSSNAWFTEDNVRLALSGISYALRKEKLEKWLKKYPGIPIEVSNAKTIGVVMAGNIPMVGFHDLVSVLVSGHKLLGRLSTKDERLMKLFTRLLVHIEPDIEPRIEFSDEYLNKTDAIIATGSNNTGRYFEYYFKNIPHIIRKNRNGIAVLTGDETENDLQKLGADIFNYFGLGCRNVTKLYLPDGFPPEKIMKTFDSFSQLAEHHKYGNNLNYNRTLYLMNNEKFFDNGAVILKESMDIASPVGVVNFEKYADLNKLNNQLSALKEQIQCIVSIDKRIEGSIKPGESQMPEMWDYADGIDTLIFLKEIV